MTLPDYLDDDTEPFPYALPLCAHEFVAVADVGSYHVAIQCRHCGYRDVVTGDEWCGLEDA